MVEIIPKPASPYPIGLSLLFYGAILIFGGVVIMFFLFEYWHDKTTDTLENLEETLTKGRTAEDIQLEKEVFLWKNKIDDFFSIIRSRKNPIPFFSFMEANTHPQVFFSQTSLSLSDNKVSLGGETSDFRTLEQQMFVFRTRKEIETFTLSNIGIGQETRPVMLGFELLFLPALFQ